MSIRKERYGMYSATVHYHDNEIIFLANSWMGAYKAASRFAWGMK